MPTLHPAMATLAAFPLESDLNDELVVERVVAGETELFAVLVRRYNQRLFRSLRAFLRDDTEAEDALQQTYVAFRNLHAFEGRSRLSGRDLLRRALGPWIDPREAYAFAGRRCECVLLTVMDAVMLRRRTSQSAYLPSLYARKFAPPRGC